MSVCFVVGKGSGQPAGGGGGTPGAGAQPAGNLKLLLCVLS